MKTLEGFLYAAKNTDFSKLEGTTYFMENIKDLHMFYVEGANSKDYVSTITNMYEPLNIPFKNCWFTLPNLSVDGCVIPAIGVMEITPSHQRIYFYVVRPQGAGQIMVLPMSFAIKDGCIALGNDDTPNKSYEGIARVVCRIIHTIVSDLHKDRLHYLSNNYKIDLKMRVGRNHERIKFYPKDVIYVGSKKELNKRPELVSRIISKPDYSYEVMGHWRNIGTSLGKDREGNRCVSGFTWVSAYTKGSGELMKKVRIVKGD